MLEVKLLGAFDVTRDGKPVTLSSRPAQSLFAYLILSAGTSHRREKLAGLLWPDSSEESARDYLRHGLWRIRKAVGSASAGGKTAPYFTADDIHICFNADSSYRLDAAVIEKIDATGASTGELMEALSQYEGELLPGFYDEWVALEREHIRSIFEQKMGTLIRRLEDEARWQEMLVWGEKWISFGQKPETAYRALMSACSALGDVSGVAAAYKRCQGSLNEFGIEPSEQTRQLYEILKSGKDVQREKHDNTKTDIAKRAFDSTNIPVPLTSFIGRGKELKEIAKLLSSARLVTLTGPGGVGKTRLAIQTAQDSVQRFKDGVFWVGLVGLSDENLVPQEIAQSLQVREAGSEPLIETLKSHLKSRDLLLVMDNCEHLIRACAQYAEQLLAACPKLKIMATSIEGLGLFNETIWQVPSLPLPALQESVSVENLKDYASIELFDERAVRAKPGFVLTENNAMSVAKICQRLDGIPLAIELAAARTKVLSVHEIASRLDDRFSLLTSGSRTAIPRHQTLRATLDWSHELLSEPERILLRRLSVFASGFTLEAAEVVCSQGQLKPADILDILGRLVDKSLVVVDSAPTEGETRYRLLETIRQYALEKLVTSGEGSEIRKMHTEFYLQLAEEAESTMYGSAAAAWFRRLDKELDNIRSAVEWSTASGNADLALRILGSLVYFWFSHGLIGSEWNDRIQAALVRPEGQKRTLARAKALNGIGFMYWADIYTVDKRAELEEALSIGRELGDPGNIAMALRNLGLLEMILGNYQAARTSLEQSLELGSEMGGQGKIGMARTLIFLGDVALNQNEAERSRSLFEESVEVLKEPGDINFLAYSVRRLGQLAWHEGEFKKALVLCRQSLELNQEVGDPRGVFACLAGFAAISFAQGKFERAAILMAAVESLLAAIGIKLLYVDHLEYQRNLATLREQMNKRTLDKFWDKGKSMSTEEAIAFALEDA